MKFLYINIDFQTINWGLIEPTGYKGETGTSLWRTLQFEDIRVRIVEYSKEYLADHWCKKGHIVYCLEGGFISEIENGNTYRISKGMSYIVFDDLSSHRSFTRNGAKLLII